MLDRSTGHTRDGRPRSPGPEDDGDVVIFWGASMPDDSDYIRMRGHINRVKSEFAALDPDLIERICQHLLVVRRARPTLKKLRAHVVELTSDHDEPTLRGMLGLPPKASAGASGGGHGTAEPPATDGGHATRRGGRPGWTPELFWARYREACERTTQPHTHRAVAQQFQALHGDRGIDPEYLRKLLRRYGPPPA